MPAYKVETLPTQDSKERLSKMEQISDAAYDSSAAAMKERDKLLKTIEDSLLELKCNDKEVIRVTNDYPQSTKRLHVSGCPTTKVQTIDDIMNHLEIQDKQPFYTLFEQLNKVQNIIYVCQNILHYFEEDKKYNYGLQQYTSRRIN